MPTYLNQEEIQEALFALLVDFDSLCLKYGFRYSLVGGTLLGAVRHKGFIPWDDDIDIYLPRPDYEQLLSLPKEALPPQREIMCRANGKIPHPFIKFVNKRIRAQEGPLKATFDEYLWLDIFPIDGLPDDLNEQMKIIRKQLRIRREMTYLDMFDPSFFTGWKGAVKKLYIKVASPFRDPAKLCEKLEAGARHYSFSESKVATQLVWRSSLARTIVPVEDFNNLITLEFEGRPFKVIPSWRQYLLNQYGSDYMELPPIEKRVTHGFKAWRV